MDQMEFVKEQIAAPDVNLSAVAEGAGVGYSWLKMFARGEIPDPGYSRIKALAQYFASRTEQQGAQ
jgi:hypothetical protein